MFCDNIHDFSKQLAPQGRLLGLDVGEKTIGLALSDAGRMIASPLETLSRVSFKKDTAALSAIIEKHKITGLIIGNPLNMDGTIGPRAQSTKQFAKNLEPLLKLPMLLWDERLSTMAITRTMLEADLSRSRQAEVVDKMAASYILQGALDRLNKQSSSSKCQTTQDQVAQTKDV